MAQTSRRSRVDIAFVVLFFALAGVGLLCAFSTLFLTAPGTQEPFYDLAPFFLGLALAGGGGAAMFLARTYFRIAGPILLITTLLWTMGALVFAFGLSALFYYEETVDFTVNLGYVVGLCIGPGLLLAAIGQLLYGFEAWRGIKQRREEGTAVPAANASADWLKALKAQEKRRLETDEQ